MAGDEIGTGDADGENLRFDRRAFGAKVAVGAAVAWVAPAVVSVQAARANTCPPAPPAPPDLTALVGPNTAFISPSLTPPAVDTKSIQSDTLTNVWAESGPVIQTTNLAVDSLLAPGTTFNALDVAAPGNGQTITATGAAPVTLYSYFIQAHQATRSILLPGGVSPIYNGSLTIPTGLQLAGISTTSVTTGLTGFGLGTRTAANANLVTTDSFKRPNMTYHYADNGNLEGIEANLHQDTVSLSADGRTVSWSLQPFDFGVFPFSPAVTSDSFRLLLELIPCT
jgi:hypothetical protein